MYLLSKGVKKIIVKPLLIRKKCKLDSSDTALNKYKSLPETRGQLLYVHDNILQTYVPTLNIQQRRGSKRNFEIFVGVL